MPAFFTTIPCHANKEWKKQIRFGKEKLNLFLLADNIIVYIESHKEFLKQLLEPVGEFMSVVGYKINILAVCS